LRPSEFNGVKVPSKNISKFVKYCKFILFQYRQHQPMT
jgi:hypothetical protein